MQTDMHRILENILIIYMYMRYELYCNPQTDASFTDFCFLPFLVKRIMVLEIYR